MKKIVTVVLLSVGFLNALTCGAGELVIAETNHCVYQIVLPDQTLDPTIEQALADGAEVMRAMFAANGCPVPVVKEAQADPAQPGIYLGDTAMARAAGIEASALPVWTYIWRTTNANLVIAGRDWPAPNAQRKGRDCSLGTVKGLTDFLREYCGTRFLAPGGLTGIEFLPTPRIAVPDELGLRREPMVNFNCGRPSTDTALIALNFLGNVTTEYQGHTHERAVPAEKYADTHPEYFALINGERIREHKHPWYAGVIVREPHLCYSNKEVQELIYQDMLRSFDDGYPEYLSLQADGFKPCQCDDCQKMFDTGDWGEKLWLLNRMWAERLLTDRPGKFLVVTAYTVTGNPPATFKKFPPNMRVKAGGYPKAFAKWDGYEIPGGFTSGLHAWGGYHLCGYLPVRTPLYTESVVRMYDEYNVKGIGLDSPPANMWGMEGPAVYVYGRMFDNVTTNNALELVEEYIQAAYGPAAYPMTKYFNELHHTLEAYAEVFGVDNGSFQTYKRADGRSVRYLTSQTKLRLIGFLYPPETLDLLESQLAQAEKTPGLTDKHKLRLALLRREFNYLNSTARVVHMYSAYQTRRDKIALDQLLDEMEARRDMIMTWYSDRREYKPGVYYQQPISPDWPMYIGGPGHYNDHLLRNGGSYLSTPVPPFTWDLEAMRKAPLFEPKTLAATRTAISLSLDSAEWNDIPAHQLGPLSLGAGDPKWASEVKAAYDANAVYLRFGGALQDNWTPPAEMTHDNTRIVGYESFTFLAAPDNNPARYFRFSCGVNDAAMYDARQGFIEDSINPLFDKDDLTWEPEWKLECAVADDAKSRRALMIIPFASLGVSAPTSGTEWKVNFSRLHQLKPGWPQEITLWSSNPGTSEINDRQAFGTLRFE